MPTSSDAAALRASFRQGASPVDHAAALLQRAGEANGTFNPFCLLDPGSTLAMARASAARYRLGAPLGPLDGIPITVKDTVDVAGWPTRRGSRTTTTEPAPRDAAVVARLRAAGAVLLGKTTTPEFAWKGLTDSPLHGVTRNPLDPALTAGGSSGGGAAAAALGLGTVHLGSDAAGSVRIPAAFCGVVGYKPTFGLLPLDPYPAAFFQLPHLGPMAATVADAALMVAVAGGPAPSDWTSLTRERPLDIAAPWPASLRLRIGVGNVGDDELDEGVSAGWRAFRAALDREVETRMVGFEYGEARDVAAALYRLGCSDAVARVPSARRSELDPGLLEFIAPVADLPGREVIRLVGRREALAAAANRLLTETVDVLVTPTMPRLPPAADPRPGRPADADWLDWCPYTPLFNLAHGPALSVPWPGRGAGSLPIGIQVGAAPGRDREALLVAALVERMARRASAGRAHD